MLEEEVYSELLGVNNSLELADEEVTKFAEACSDTTDLEKNPKVLTTEQATFLADVRVPVTVELGLVNLSAAELIDLLPGAKFPFEIADEALITLRVGDESIGKAVFVEKNGGIGLQIVSVGTINSTLDATNEA